MEKKTFHKKSFTLLELLIVIIVIGILASAVLPQYTKFSERSRAAEAKHMLAAIRRSQIRYFTQYSTYTATVTNLDIERGNARYFNYFTSSATPNRVGYATRTTLQRPAGYAAYVMYINENGTYSITAGYGHLL